MALPDIAYMVPVVLKPLHRPPHSLADIPSLEHLSVTHQILAAHKHFLTPASSHPHHADDHSSMLPPGIAVQPASLDRTTDLSRTKHPSPARCGLDSHLPGTLLPHVHLSTTPLSPTPFPLSAYASASSTPWQTAAPQTQTTLPPKDQHNTFNSSCPFGDHELTPNTYHYSPAPSRRRDPNSQPQSSLRPLCRSYHGILRQLLL